MLTEKEDLPYFLPARDGALSDVEGKGDKSPEKNGHICVFVSLKTAHLTVVLLHEGGEHYEEPFRCLIRQRRRPSVRPSVGLGSG